MELRWGLMSPSKGCECPQNCQGHCRGWLGTPLLLQLQVLSTCQVLRSMGQSTGHPHHVARCSALFTGIFQQGQSQDNAENHGSVTCAGAPGEPRASLLVSHQLWGILPASSPPPLLHPCFMWGNHIPRMYEVSNRSAFAHCPPCPLGHAALAAPSPWVLRAPPQQAQVGWENLGVVFLAQSWALAGAQQTPARYSPGIRKKAVTLLTGSTFGHLDGCYSQRPQVTLWKKAEGHWSGRRNAHVYLPCSQTLLNPESPEGSEPRQYTYLGNSLISQLYHSSFHLLPYRQDHLNPQLPARQQQWAAPQCLLSTPLSLMSCGCTPSPGNEPQWMDLLSWQGRRQRLHVASERKWAQPICWTGNTTQTNAGAFI